MEEFLIKKSRILECLPYYPLYILKDIKTSNNLYTTYIRYNNCTQISNIIGHDQSRVDVELSITWTLQVCKYSR